MDDHSPVSVESLTLSRFSRRNAILADMGFESYRAYLASDLWASIKSRVVERDKQCKLCGRKSYTAHHVTYSRDVMLGKDLSQLFAICRGCHRVIEFDGDEKLKSGTLIAKKAWKRAIAKTGGSRSKRFRKATLPRCVLCRKQVRKLGRGDCCLRCHRSGRVLKALQETQKP